jgi:hypothetical protein
MHATVKAALGRLRREFLEPPPAVPPGRELQHLVEAVASLRLQVRLVQLQVEALRAEARSK